MGRVGWRGQSGEGNRRGWRRAGCMESRGEGAHPGIRNCVLVQNMCQSHTCVRSNIQGSVGGAVAGGVRV